MDTYIALWIVFVHADMDRIGMRVEDSRMLRGREFIESRLAWSGLAYILPPHVVHFAYDIHVGSTHI